MKNYFKPILFFALYLWHSNVSAQLVTTLAGSGVAGDANGTGVSAAFNQPNGICADAAGNVYVADSQNNKIKKITPSGVVTTFAGSGTAGFANGTGTAASFSQPMGICIDNTGNIYVADCNNHRIRKITPGGVVTTHAGIGVAGTNDGPAATANVSSPSSVCIDAAGNVYYTELSNRIKIISGGFVSIFAGAPNPGSANGTGTNAMFNLPMGLSIDNSGNIIVADYYNHMIRSITPAAVVTTLAGSISFGSADAVGAAASFYYPTSTFCDAAGNIFVCDRMNNKVRKIAPGNIVTTIAGTGLSGYQNGPASTATFAQPWAICLDVTGNIYLGDGLNHVVRKIEPATPCAALNFDGIDDIVNLPANPLVNNLGTGSITMEAWVHPTNINGERTIISKDGNYTLRLSNGFIYADVFTAGSGGTYWHSTSTIGVAVNQWTHVAAVWDGTGMGMHIYINGFMTTPAMNTSTSSTTGNLCIGASPNSGHFFEGSLDEVRIWNRALCNAELLHHMNCEINTGANGLILAYHFNQGWSASDNSTVTTLIDSSGNNLHGTLSSFTLNDTVSNWVTPGAISNGTLCSPFSNAITAGISSQFNVSCNGKNDGSASVSATGPGTLHFQWLPSGSNSMFANSLYAGMQTCTITNDCGATEIVTVTITEPAPINVGLSTVGSTVSTVNQPGATYQWINCATSQPVAGETNVSFTPSVTGQYAVVVTMGVCTDTSACATVVINGIYENNEDAIGIYPNPTEGKCIVNTISANAKIEIVNTLGKTIFTTVSSSPQTQIDFSSYSNGIYFLMVYSENKCSTAKLIKQ